MGRLNKSPAPMPDRVLLAGVEGIGKSSFAASFPAPAFLAAEDGIGHLAADPRFDLSVLTNENGSPIRTWEDAIAAIRWLERTSEHDRRTLVVDSVDWLEPLAWQHLCKANGWSDIEGAGYGKGYVAAGELWRQLIAALDAVRRAGLEVVLIAHVAVKTFQNPSGLDFSRYELALHKTTAALTKEWVDSHLFVTWEQHEGARKGEKKVKGTSTGERIVWTRRDAAHDAKSRWNLPETFYLPGDPTAGHPTYAHFRAAGGCWREPAMRWREAPAILPDAEVKAIARAIATAAAEAPAGDTVSDSIAAAKAEAAARVKHLVVECSAAELFAMANELLGRSGAGKEAADFIAKNERNALNLAKAIVKLERIERERMSVNG